MRPTGACEGIDRVLMRGTAEALLPCRVRLRAASLSFRPHVLQIHGRRGRHNVSTPPFRYDGQLASRRMLVLRGLRGVLNNHGNNHGLAAQTARNPGTDGAAHNLLQLLHGVHLLGRTVQSIL